MDNKVKLMLKLLFGLFGLLNFVQSEDQIYNLKQLKINTNEITTSGFSAGGAMATQMNIAHSSLFSGVGIFGMVYYMCGPNSLIEYAIRCSKTGLGILPYNINDAISATLAFNKSGVIDNLNSLERQKVFVWAAGADEYVPPKQVEQNVQFYRRFIKAPYRISFKEEKSAKHLFPTENFGAPCNQNAEHNLYLGNCNYSGAYESLSYLITSKQLQKPTTVDYANVPISQLKVFDQTEFYSGQDGNITRIGMGNLGHIYIPSYCESGENECFLHFNFHGCNEWPLNLGRNYSINSGFLPVAQLNNIIVVFPLTTAIESNMNGCWDFFSYTGKNFATKNGEQIKVIYAMLQRLLNGL